MPRKKTAPATVETPTPADEAAPAGAAPPSKPMTKGQAMDAAIAAGADLPADAVAYVKKHFGMDVSNKQFSTHKSLVRQKATIDVRDKLAKPTRKPTTAVAATPAISASFEQPAQSAAKGPASPAELARTIKALVADHGAGAVGEMLDVFRE
jgi:hypothetical protein